MNWRCANHLNREIQDYSFYTMNNIYLGFIIDIHCILVLYLKYQFPLKSELRIRGDSLHMKLILIPQTTRLLPHSPSWNFMSSDDHIYFLQNIKPRFVLISIYQTITRIKKVTSLHIYGFKKNVYFWDWYDNILIIIASHWFCVVCMHKISCLAYDIIFYRKNCIPYLYPP